ncbi:MAG: hypothetical protein SFT93_01325 [Rickettsiaceae bacterium]|nr:hypothetical protein [Rickettsiaceae bacterium]
MNHLFDLEETPAPHSEKTNLENVMTKEMRGPGSIISSNKPEESSWSKIYICCKSFIEEIQVFLWTAIGISGLAVLYKAYKAFGSIAHTADETTRKVNEVDVANLNATVAQVNNATQVISNNTNIIGAKFTDLDVPRINQTFQDIQTAVDIINTRFTDLNVPRINQTFADIQTVVAIINTRFTDLEVRQINETFADIQTKFGELNITLFNHAAESVANAATPGAWFGFGRRPTGAANNKVHQPGGDETWTDRDPGSGGANPQVTDNNEPGDPQTTVGYGLDVNTPLGFIGENGPGSFLSSIFSFWH